jgi:hypothetical protein
MFSLAARSQGARLGTEESLYVIVDDGADCCCTPLYLQFQSVSAGQCERDGACTLKAVSTEEQGARVQWQVQLLSHGDAHAWESAVGGSRYNLQTLRDQRRFTVEMWLELDELLIAAIVVGLVTTQINPFCTDFTVAVPAGQAVINDCHCYCNCRRTS